MYVAKYFHKSRLKCQCGCDIYNVCDDLLIRMDYARELYGRPIYCTSCCRCPAHNKEVGGMENSSHITTESQPSEAMDLLCTNPYTAYDLVKCLYEAGFRRIIMYHNKPIIHVDVDKYKPQEVLRIY